MFDLSKEFEDFYKKHIVLPRDIKSDLRAKKELNLDRLDSGLDEYNSENSTAYEVADSKEQGSVAMSTVTQNDSNDFDIDVAVIFDEDNIGEETGSTKVKNIVADALKRKCVNFKTEPAAHTNCVRIEYADNYHIDFAIFKKVGDIYYHAGSSWRERNPIAINEWFQEAMKEKGEKLRRVIRLSKMFCKSRDNWIMPGGLIQSVLCVECFVYYDRLDECFYYTMKNIINRLNLSIEVNNPTDSSKSLLLKQKDRDKINNWKSRLSEKLSKMDIVTKSECTKKQAYDSWHDFFSHPFWNYNPVEETNNRYTNVVKEYPVPGEEFIEQKYPIDIRGAVHIDCIVSANGFRPQSIISILNSGKWLPRDRKLSFSCHTDVLNPDMILWKVRNVGEEARRRNDFRGKIFNGGYSIQEYTRFNGPHYVECYIIKNGKCVAKERLDVPIE